MRLIWAWLSNRSAEPIVAANLPEPDLLKWSVPVLTPVDKLYATFIKIGPLCFRHFCETIEYITMCASTHKATDSR